MPDDQPDIPAEYAELVAAMVDTNSGTVKPEGWTEYGRRTRPTCLSDALTDAPNPSDV